MLCPVAPKTIHFVFTSFHEESECVSETPISSKKTTFMESFPSSFMCIKPLMSLLLILTLLYTFPQEYYNGSR